MVTRYLSTHGQAVPSPEAHARAMMMLKAKALDVTALVSQYMLRQRSARAVFEAYAAYSGALEMARLLDHHAGEASALTTAVVDLMADFNRGIREQGRLDYGRFDTAIAAVEAASKEVGHA